MVEKGVGLGHLQRFSPTYLILWMAEQGLGPMDQKLGRRGTAFLRQKGMKKNSAQVINHSKFSLKN